ncbi:threonyl-tRNA synthetase [Klebsormidium nitens]|uniref:threonine--tRNA ligase n=1 Tax=Klebsormidium nitens TaxID=105231 RepID=A0A1Y1IJ25_KLENI|nr:threonyl-tRNA synthetase [Klebsormidium nitens]|eukprot:GAQ89131.1 threonyl-tRNA synthetase [Klebsormidium nitens]
MQSVASTSGCHYSGMAAARVWPAARALEKAIARHVLPLRISRGVSAPSLPPTFHTSSLPQPSCHHSLFSTTFIPPNLWSSASSSPLLPSLSRRPLSVAAVASTVQESVAEAPQHVPKKPDGPPERERVELPTNDSSETLLKIRHTSAHVMAMAVQKLFPGTQVTIGPWIEKGFYYDFDTKEPITDKDLKKIKKEMARIISKKLPLTREEVTREEARRRIEEIQEPYKLEILDGIKTEPITIYKIGEDWWDLCAGPHVEHTGQLPVKAIELETVAGAYWRGDENRQQLQRIYGTAWENEAQLAEYVYRTEQARLRDHRKLGQELKLFSIQDETGSGLVFWHPKGAMIRSIIEQYWKQQHLRNGYELLSTPHVAKLELWKTSGHFDFYKENMFDQMAVEDEKYQLKPMNCPCHIAIYKDSLHSYRELPIRWAELGTVYRYEKSGTMHGLFRVRGFTQDDAHIFCLPSQIADEILGVLDLTEAILRQFDFTKFEVNLSTRPEKAVGSDGIWERATTALREALDRKGWEYGIDEGGGAFYGPKIDIKIEDAIGRRWQCSTIQVDFNLPERFQMEYQDADGERKRPIMIHRAIFGSLERFFGVLIENYAGDFPLWLAPVQARVLPITDSQVEYAHRVARQLKAHDIRVEVVSGERLPKLVRNANADKIPLQLVVGKQEEEHGSVAITARGPNGDRKLGEVDVAELAERLKVAEAAKKRWFD